jgi:LuxR family maltose regulon positive regulatory protein
MRQTTGLTGYDIPSNKFYPPHVDESQSFLRDRLLAAKLPGSKHDKKAIIIEAQAGQGKTTLIAQFLDINKLSFIWYQIGPEDSDPFLLLHSLLVNLKLQLATFESPKLEEIFQKGTVGPLDLKRCANMLLHDLADHLKEDIYLVFDDMHLIEFDALTNGLFEHLLDTSPPMVHFVFISRQPLTVKGKTIINGSTISYLNTEDLALDDQEVETLFNQVLKKDISRQDATKIQSVTNGWIMGIILAGHPISGQDKFWLSPQEEKKAPSQGGHMLDYFKDEIFAQIPDHLHTTFLKLSFLHQVTSELASKLSGIDDFGQILSNMASENYFVYHLDDEEQAFRFHHFFQEFLQQDARRRLDEDEIASIFSLEAHYYLEREQTELALTSFKSGGDFKAMEEILKEKGMELIIKNRTFSILALLQTIPDEILFKHQWLVLYSGLLRVDYQPHTTLPFWNAAREMFTETGEEVGEIIALSQSIYFHFVISGEYRESVALLERAELLFERNQKDLSPPIFIMVARNLASGFCFFSGDMIKAQHYIQMATKLSVRLDLKTFIASSKFIQGYIELLSGNRAKCLREMETCFSLLNDPLVGESNRLTMRILSLCYLSMTGDHHNFRLQQLATQRLVNATIVDQTVAAPYLLVWGSSGLYSSGKTEKGLELIEKGLQISTTATTSHMKSQLLQWQAFGFALTGNVDKALSQIRQAKDLRELAGGPFYEAFHFIIAGAVYTRAKDFEKAQTNFTKGLAIAERIPSTYLMICALFNISYFKYQSQGVDAAIDDLEAGLTLMKINGYNHFWSWEPKMMLTLLALAVNRDIEKSFAMELAAARLKHNFDDNSNALPLLHFSLLDGFSLGCGGKILFHAKDLTPFQRELLGLLITAKGRRIPQEKIQLELWPDKAPENARKSFDTLLTRLRKEIGPKLPLPVKQYLSLQKGILCLTNYEIDAIQFREAARTGIAHAKNNDWWQAYNAFENAMELWKGTLPEDTFQSEQVLEINDTLSHLLVKMAVVWARNLAESSHLTEAVNVLEKALLINNLEEQLTAMLYHFHLQNSKPLKARETLERYKKALLQADYTEKECSQYIEEILKSEGIV